MPNRQIRSVARLPEEMATGNFSMGKLLPDFARLSKFGVVHARCVESGERNMGSGWE
jgi:hypothetical protein